MGEAKASRSRARILAESTRCIYCSEPAVSIEHMPPIAMFRGRQRPSGMEYANCKICNNGTSSADLVGSFLARLSAWQDDVKWREREAYNSIDMMIIKAPDFIKEFFNPAATSLKWVRDPRGILRKRIVLDAPKPITQSYIDVFAAKFGMAMYYEHCRSPIPLEGGVYSAAYLNYGLSRDAAHTMLAIMPMANMLRQGSRNNSKDQFIYRYNTDEKTIVAALAQFHDGLYVCTIAFSDVNTYKSILKLPNFRLARPGDLISMMPKPTPTPTQTSQILFPRC